MNTLKQILFTFAAIIGLSVAISAQKDDQKKPPPKDPNGPVVIPREKPPPQKPPGDGKKPKKPGMEYSMAQRKETLNIA